MPAKMTKNSDGSYRVRTPNQVHAYSTTLEKARKLVRLLNAVEHGWHPTNFKEGKRNKK